MQRASVSCLSAPLAAKEANVPGGNFVAGMTRTATARADPGGICSTAPLTGRLAIWSHPEVCKKLGRCACMLQEPCGGVSCSSIMLCMEAAAGRLQPSSYVDRRPPSSGGYICR